MRPALFQKLCLASALSLTVTSLNLEKSSAAEAPTSEPPLAGDYIIVDGRSASDVATMATPNMHAALPIGERVTFHPAGFSMDQIPCSAWTIEPMTTGTIPVESDPNLIDLWLGPSDSPISAGDQRIGKNYTVTCEGRFFSRIFQVDDRVAVMSWANSAINLILEKPLSSAQIERYQSKLKSIKFYEGEISGVLDKETLAASRIWFKYRANLDERYPIPARPAMSENLLDALDVLMTKGAP